ncbi:unnamed protein product, partial [Mesorhabditis belari]|uniref:Coiled-coil domain-containing protein 130 n=1 Tax=Mesorhabditis belari TaxID=2138241 RepID=A0AAF3ETX6_9BILA
MGERKGQNHYYPPDFDYKKHKTLNAYHGTHALRERASKIGQGILVIRFEMPYNVWCLGCRNHVGMGVRYNAEKKKIGMYYTTPLYEFRMKCHLCDNYYVMRTDPKNLDYECFEGLSRQKKQWEPEENGQFPGYERTKAGSAMSQKLAADAMFKQEHGVKDKEKADTTEKDLNTLEWLQERTRDDYSANSHLRARFRTQKNDLNEQRAKDDALKARGGLTIELLPERPDDKRIAGLVMKQSRVKTFDETQEEARDAVEGRRIFNKPSTSSVNILHKNLTSQDRLKDSMRKTRNKWLNDQFASASGSGIGEKRKLNGLGIIRKRVKEEVDGESIEEIKEDADEVGDSEVPQIKEEKASSNGRSSETTPISLTGLVDYGSESESGSE